MRDPYESQILSNDRAEWQSARDEQDRGGYRRIAGVVVEEWPSADEVSFDD